MTKHNQQNHNQNIQNNINKANILINKALKTNPINITTLNFALGHLQKVISETESLNPNSSAKVKEQDIIIKSEKQNKDKVLGDINGDNSEEHF